MKPLNPQQARFAEEYLVDANATQAAIRAGYSASTAHAQASRLLKNPRVSAAVAAAQKARSQRLEITADRVIAELALIAFSNMSDYIEITQAGDPVIALGGMTRAQAAAVQALSVDVAKGGRADARDVVRIRFRLADKKGALEILGRHLGLFKDSQSTEGALSISELKALAEAYDEAERRRHGPDPVVN